MHSCSTRLVIAGADIFLVMLLFTIVTATFPGKEILCIAVVEVVGLFVNQSDQTVGIGFVSNIKRLTSEKSVISDVFLT